MTSQSCETKELDFGLRYKRKGRCLRCGSCCLCEDPACEYLSFDDNVAVCLIYKQADRPLRCKLFPEMPPIPKEFKDCGFYFLDTWEDNKIVKRHL